MNRNDINELIATDAGRKSGCRWIMDMAKWKNLFRLWISSQTDKAILDGFKSATGYSL